MVTKWKFTWKLRCLWSRLGVYRLQELEPILESLLMPIQIYCEPVLRATNYSTRQLRDAYFRSGALLGPLAEFLPAKSLMVFLTGDQRWHEKLSGELGGDAEWNSPLCFWRAVYFKWDFQFLKPFERVRPSPSALDIRCPSVTRDTQIKQPSLVTACGGFIFNN